MPSTTLPVDQNLELSLGESSGFLDAEGKSEYQQITGSISWIVSHQFPPLRIYHHILARYLAKPTKKWFKVALRILKWLYDHRQDRFFLGLVPAENATMT